MILKITDGVLTHYLDGFEEVRVTEMHGYVEGDDLPEDADGVSTLCLWLPHEPSEDEPVVRQAVLLQPAMSPKSISPRTILTDFPVYLLNEAGKTVEVINRVA